MQYVTIEGHMVKAIQVAFKRHQFTVLTRLHKATELEFYLVNVREEKEVYSVAFSPSPTKSPKFVMPDSRYELNYLVRKRDFKILRVSKYSG